MTDMIEAAELSTLINKMPMLNLAWPADIQAQWWKWFDDLSSRAALLRQSASGEPSEEQVDRAIHAFDQKVSPRQGMRAALQASGIHGQRSCTCHPDDNPPVPCPQKYALTECRASQAPVGVTELNPIDSEGTRHYIPLPGGWEIQTKGSGSTFRIAHVRGPGDYDRWPVLDDHLHKPLEDMARAVHSTLSLRGVPEGWRPGASFPRDGFPFLYWDDQCAIPETVAFLNGSKIATPGLYPYAGGGWFVTEERAANGVWQPIPVPPQPGGA